MRIGFARVNGHSMIPTYAPGDLVLVRYGSHFHQDDVVLVDFGNRMDIKRINNISGDQVFIGGDNSFVSVDSRHYGAVRANRILAKVVYRLPRWLAKK